MTQSPEEDSVVFVGGAQHAFEHLPLTDKIPLLNALQWVAAGDAPPPPAADYRIQFRDGSFHLRVGALLVVGTRLGSITAQTEREGTVVTEKHIPVGTVLVDRVFRALNATERMAVRSSRNSTMRNSEPGRSATLLTRLAARLAGSRRSHLPQDWASVLAGSPEDGIRFSSHQQAAMALGFLLAALRMRMRDVARPAWRPVDWLLSRTSRSNAFIATAVGAQAVYIVDDGGLGALITEIWEPCGIAGAGLYALSRWLRRVRGIELAGADPDAADE
jgi:hypothetical protein